MAHLVPDSSNTAMWSVPEILRAPDHGSPSDLAQDFRALPSLTLPLSHESDAPFIAACSAAQGLSSDPDNSDSDNSHIAVF